jgi:hypothetical protein
MILSRAREKIDRFNKLGVHYNIVANHVYEKRKSFSDLFGADYLPYLVAALISFDMERMMGQGTEKKYDVTTGGFATRLHKKLTAIKPKIEHLNKINLVDVDLEGEQENIESAYKELSARGADGLNQKGGDFHVGTTKILHFLNPELFLIVDSNAAQAFSQCHHRIKYRVLPAFPCDFFLGLIDSGHERYQTVRADTGASAAVVGAEGDLEEGGRGDRGGSCVRGGGLGMPGVRATHARAWMGEPAVAAPG